MPPAPKSEPQGRRTVIVYIVDDNETNLALFEAAVRKVDPTLTPICFADPIEAAEACRERMPDAVLVDFTMPGIDGHEFVRRLRRLPDFRRGPDHHDHRNHRATDPAHRARSRGRRFSDQAGRSLRTQGAVENGAGLAPLAPRSAGAREVAGTGRPASHPDDHRARKRPEAEFGHCRCRQPEGPARRGPAIGSRRHLPVRRLAGRHGPGARKRFAEVGSDVASAAARALRRRGGRDPGCSAQDIAGRPGVRQRRPALGG